MGVRGGSPRAFTLAGRSFDVSPEASLELLLGGFVNEAKVTGNGALHITQNRRTGRVALKLSIDDARQDIEFLQGKINAAALVPMTCTMPSGVVYAGSVVITGDLQKDDDGMVTVTVEGVKVEQI